MGAYDKSLPVLNPRKIPRGKYGRVFDEDGNYMDNVTEFEAKIKFDKKKIERGNAFLDGNRIMGGSGTGKIKLYLTDSNLIRSIAENPDKTYTLIGELADVDTMAAASKYKVAIRGINFDEVDLHSFKVKDNVEIDLPFTFDDFEYLD